MRSTAGKPGQQRVDGPGAAHPRQVEVHQDETQARKLRGHPQRFLRATRGPHGRATQQRAQQLHERVSIERMVVDDERAGRHEDQVLPGFRGTQYRSWSPDPAPAHRIRDYSSTVSGTIVSRRTRWRVKALASY